MADKKIYVNGLEMGIMAWVGMGELAIETKNFVQGTQLICLNHYDYGMAMALWTDEEGTHYMLDIANVQASDKEIHVPKFNGYMEDYLKMLAKNYGI